MQRKYAIASIVMGAFFASPAAATDAEVLAQLRAMQEEINSLKGEVKTLRRQLGNATERVEKAEVKSRLSSIKMAEQNAKAEARKETDVKVSLTPAPKFETADGEYSFKIGGFAQVDAGMFNDSTRRDHPDGTSLRRARINVSGNITKDFKYKLENDFANNASALTDVYLEYTGLDPVSVMIGQFKEPFSLETLTSDIFTTFIERASPTAFSPDRKIGLAVSTRGSMDYVGAWTLSGGVFGAGTGTASTDDEARDFTARITIAPVAEKDKVIHLGMAGSHRIPDSASNDIIRVMSRPETSLTSSQAVDTGNVTGVNYMNLLGLEAAGVWGPAAIQGEYMVAEVDRHTAMDATLGGYYAEASYYLTGESKNYQTATAKFDRVKPKNNFSWSKGTWGAWQVAARYSSLDLTDGSISGGKMNNWTLALKWLPHAHVMTTLNYIKVNTSRNSTTPYDDPDVWMMRVQFDF